MVMELMDPLALKHDFRQKKVIGLLEHVKLLGTKKTVIKKAIVDTGATRTCVDMKLAGRIGLGAVVGSVRVKNKQELSGHARRPIVRGVIELQNVRIPLDISIEDRSGMYYKVLIGRDAIYGRFVVDIEKTHNSYKIKDVSE